MRQAHASPFAYLARFVVQCSCALCAITRLSGGEPASTNSAAGHILLNGSLGQIVKVPTNALPANLLPRPGIGLEYQVPQPARGIQVPEPVQQRLKETQQKQTNTEFFPAAPPSLMPYLGSSDELGNTAIRPDPLIPRTPWDALLQGAKYELSHYGLRYGLKQTVTFVAMTDVKQGDDTLGLLHTRFPRQMGHCTAPPAAAPPAGSARKSTSRPASTTPATPSRLSQTSAL